MLLILGLISLGCQAQDLGYALVHVTPNDGTTDAYKFCVGYGQVDFGLKFAKTILTIN